MKQLLLAFALFTGITAFAQPAPQWTWTDQGRGSNWDDGSSVAANNIQQIYGTGYFSSPTCIFGTDTLTSNGVSDVYIVKYDWDNTFMWAKSFGGSDYEYGMSIACDAAGNVIVVGNFYSATLVLGSDTLTNLNAGTPDMFIAKLDPQGNFLWARRAGGNNWDNCASVAINMTTNDIYVAGAFYVDDFVFAGDTIFNHSLYDMVLMKYDANGNELWARGSGGNFNDLANSVAVGNNGEVYIAGGFASDSLPLMTDTLINAFGSIPDIFAVRYDANGNEIWARRWGSNDNDHSVAVTVDLNDNVLISGHYHSASFTVGNDTLNNMGEGDVFLIKTDANGNSLWGRTFGGADHDFGYSVTTDWQGDIFVTGMFMSMTVNVAMTTLSNASMDEDMIIVRYDQTGFANWATSAGGTGRDYINNIVYSMGVFFVAGGFSSNSFSIASMPFTNSGPGTGEAFFGRIDVPTSLETISNNGSVNVYPNPGNGVFNFSASSTIESITIYNTLGEVVAAESNVNTTQTSIELTDQPAGMYFYSVVQNDGVVITGSMIKH